MIKRILTDVVVNNLKDGFINVIYGPRRVGKTVLLGQIIEKLGMDKERVISFNGDTQETREVLSSTSEVKLSGLVERYECIIVDEAQRIENIGLALKILVDKYPKKKFLVSGSSSLMLAQGLKEPLTGRSLKYCLYPLSTAELGMGWADYQKKSILPEQLILGAYPYLTELSLSEEKQGYLESIIDDYLFKDVLALADISFPEILRKLAKLLAFQIGSEVSLNELSRSLGIDVATVKKYIALLKQSFVIFELPAFSGNLRKEVVKSKKYYFWDMGIRNALIGQFAPIDIRPDVGQLWENFLAIERMKKHEYAGTKVNHYFWRTWEQAEVDWVEEEGRKLTAFEFKFNKDKVRTPKVFRETYGEEVKLVNRENYLEFVI